jgi:large subunit ribosomal protein L25
VKRVQLKAEKREVSTKGMLNKYRNEGFIPGIVYGENLNGLSVIVNEREFLVIAKKEGRNVLVDLDIQGNVYPTIFKEIQRNPIGGKILHVDFEAVNLEKPIYTTIPVVTKGEAKGIKMGGILDQELYKVEVEGLLTDIPDNIEVDITDLEIKDVYYVKDLKIPEKIKLYTPLDAVVVSVVTPTVEEVKAPAAEEVAVEGAAEEVVPGAETGKEEKGKEEKIKEEKK